MSTSLRSLELTTAQAIDSLYVMFCTFLLLVIILGIAMFYSGLTQRRSALTMLGEPLIISCVIFVDWYIWSYSLCYSSSSNRFIGNLEFAVLGHLKDPLNYIYSTPRGDILAIVHFLFNGFMKVICATLTFPACAAERGRFLPMLVFVFLWSAMVYNPVSYWFWNKNGWLSPQLNLLPVLDFAGGNCIHIVSGFTALAYSFYLGPRNPKILHNYRGSNTLLSVIGLSFLILGWCGFIAGCDYKFSIVSFYLITSVFLSAFTAGLFWTAIDYFYLATPLDLEGECEVELPQLLSTSSESKTLVVEGTKVFQKRTFSLVSYSSGAMCGLVVFTPAGGYMCAHGDFWKSIVCGAIGGVAGNLSTRFKYFLKVDDALDIFAVHGICGIVGSLLVGLFADVSYESKGGWVAHNWIQLAYQLLGVVATGTYVFIVSLFFLYVCDMIPGMHLRVDKGFNSRARNAQKLIRDAENGKQSEDSAMEAAELHGSDYYELNGEYVMDFVEFIKVIDPEDFAADDSVVETIPESDRQLSPHALHRRRKTEE